MMVCSCANLTLRDRKTLMTYAFAESKKMTKKGCFKCPLCPKICTYMHNMKSHLETVHLKPYDQYLCGICEKGYTWKTSLYKHIQVKHPEYYKSQATD